MIINQRNLTHEMATPLNNQIPAWLNRFIVKDEHDQFCCYKCCGTEFKLEVSFKEHLKKKHTDSYYSVYYKYFENKPANTASNTGQTPSPKRAVSPAVNDVIALVKANPDSKASHLATLSGKTKSEINHYLYQALGVGLLRVDERFRWSVTNQYHDKDINHELEKAKNVIENTMENLLLLGKAGSGKTTFLRMIMQNEKKLKVVLAPSGIAAINAGGVTIHSFFHFDLMPYIPGKKADLSGMTSAKIDTINRLKTIIIDEISMVRADILDRIDATLRAVRKDTRPFGGIQMVLIGDLRQLPPVVDEKTDDIKVIESNYDSPYFFDSHIMKRTNFNFIELKKVYRQSEGYFVELLNRVRDNLVTVDDIIAINSKYRKQIPENNGSINLVTHNYISRKLNAMKLNELPGEEFTFTASCNHWFVDNPAPYYLNLKVGAHVMFVKNNPPQYVNGTLGIVDYVDEDTIRVRLDKTNDIIEVEPAIWIKHDYVYNKTTNSITIVDRGSYKQYPLTLAWAITIHKSQGQTFQKVNLDLAKCFAEGQAYVALSRCTSLDGITLTSPLRREHILTDSRVDRYLKEMREKGR